MLMGIVRCSTKEQHEDLQVKALLEAGVPQENIFIEKISGVSASRPVLEDVISRLREGDVLITNDLSRLARSTKQLLNILERIEEKGASYRSLREPIDTGTAAGKMTLTMLSAVVQFQRDMIVKNCEDGREAKRSKAAKLGAKANLGGAPRLSDETYNEAIELYATGVPVREISKTVGLSVSSLYRELNRRGISRK